MATKQIGKAPTPTATGDEITIQQVARRTSQGRYVYNIHKGRVVRRIAGKRGRPHYEVVAGITISATEKVLSKNIAANGALAKALLATKA